MKKTVLRPVTEDDLKLAWKEFDGTCPFVSKITTECSCGCMTVEGCNSCIIREYPREYLKWRLRRLLKKKRKRHL